MYELRRDALCDKLPDNTITLFFSGKAPYKVGDEKYEFSVDRNFYYLTGLDKENMILAFVKVNNEVSEAIFIEHYDETQAKWVGGKLLPEEVNEITHIDDIYWLEEVNETIGYHLSRFFANHSQVSVYADFTKQEAYQAESEAFRFTRELQKQYPYITLQNVASFVAELPLLKEESEIENLIKAIEVTDEGIQAMLKNAKPNMSENQIEAYFDFVLKSNNARHSFPSIVAGGKNATILHYAENNQIVKQNNLVLCDLGASYHYINADITRTFPVGGTFTTRQKEIYNIVLAANKLIISKVKPGITLRDLNNTLIAFYEKELKQIGLLKKGKSVSDYYWHGVSHMLGLETHDVTLPNYALRIGNVFTVEPGLYIEEENIGIRIEDNILVTKEGCINLSQNIIKEVEDIEAFMAQYQNS